MVDVELKRGYEVLPDNNVRFGIRVINNSDFAISEVEVILDYSESLFVLEGSKVQNLGTIPPAIPRTAQFILKPRGCIHKEEIGATVRYKDHQWKRHSVEMLPKEVHCVCPYLKEKPITRAEFLSLSTLGYAEERGVNFEAISVNKVVDFLLHTCQNRLYRVDDVPIDNGRILYLAGDALGEKAYYLLTAVVKEYEGVIQVLLRASSDKRHGLTGFLNEILENLRHLVSSARAREIGIIKKEQVINIIDSVVQRSSITTGGEGAPSVTIKDSVVQRTEFREDEAAKRRREEEERLRREQEERERRAREEQDRLRREEEEKKERERKAREEAERKKREQEQKAKQEAERLKREREEQEREISKPHEAVKPPEAEREPSRVKIFAVIIVLGAALLGYWGFTALSHDSTQPDTSAALPTSMPTSTPTATPSATPAVTSAPAPAATLGNTYTNSLGMEFVLIPAGEFEMGSPSNEADRFDDEGPVHQVTIEKAYYMSKYEVTQAQWRAVMGDNPSYFKGDDNLPVEQVSWDDVQEFIRKLNEQEGAEKYRLPSEAEWEYACRAGTTTRFSFGDSDANLGVYAWYGYNAGSKTHPVGQKKPNQWGLYDMHGNVWEWVQDTWHDNYNGAPTDGSAWEGGSGPSRVTRGGSWYHYSRICRSAYRDSFGQSPRSDDLGFRLVREV